METELTRRLGIALPIVKAPLAGSGDTPALVAEVCEAGGLGIFGAAYLDGDAVAAAAAEIRRRTAKPFGINLFVPAPAPAPAPGNAKAAFARLARHFEAVGIEPPTALPASPHPDFDRQFTAMLESGASVFSFAFGALPAAATAEAKARGLLLIGTAASVAEAAALERGGCDAVVVQGSEAGGHRGGFDGTRTGAAVGTLALVPQAVDAVSIPVIASGGIMDGRGIAAALALGADAAQLGTAFLTCVEAGTPDCHRAAILGGQEDATGLTTAFSGRAARGIVNGFMRDMEDAEGSEAILPFPFQNALTRPMRTAATAAGDADRLSLWAGQGLRLARSLPARELVAALERETREALRRLRD